MWLESAAAIGVISALGACGDYLIPRAFGASLKATGGVGLALTAFLAFDATCIGLTWWFYVQKKAVLAPAADAGGVQALEARCRPATVAKRW